MFPPQTQLGDGLDFAFLAAADSGTVQMRHLVQAVAREWQKLGKLPSASEFKQYYPWLEAGYGASIFPSKPLAGGKARG